MGYELIQFLRNNGLGEFDNMAIQLVLATRSATFKQCPPETHNKNAIAKPLI
jgi:hypothetical protein